MELFQSTNRVLNYCSEQPHSIECDLVETATKIRNDEIPPTCRHIWERCLKTPERRAETYPVTSKGHGMAEVINLRTVRKRVKRQKRDQSANANRLAFGQPKHVRKLEAAQQAKASRDLDRRRIETGDRR